MQVSPMRQEIAVGFFGAGLATATNGGGGSVNLCDAAKLEAAYGRARSDPNGRRHGADKPIFAKPGAAQPG